MKKLVVRMCVFVLLCGAFAACGKDNNNGGNTGGNGTAGADWTAVSNTTFGTNAISSVAYGAALGGGNGTFVAGGYNGKMAYSTNNGVNWTAVSGSTFGTNCINSITYGASKFVAVFGTTDSVHPDGGIAYSTDGITWTKVSTPATREDKTDNLNAIAYGDGKFVAVGYGPTMIYSTDAINWAEVPNPPYGIIWFSIGYGAALGGGASKFVAVGRTHSVIAYSADGIHWTETETDSIKDHDPRYEGSSVDMYGVAYGPGGGTALGGGDGMFVAVGGEYNSSKIVYSPDGINWTEVSNTTFGTNQIQSIAWGGDRFVAGAAYGKAAYSTDGITWTAISKTGFGSSEHISGIAYGAALGGGATLGGGDGTFVAVGFGSNGGKIVYSTGGSDANPTGGNGNNPNGGGAAGKLTITGLPGGGSYAVYVFPVGYDVSTVIGVTQGIAGNQIASSQPSSGNVFTIYTYPGLTSSFTVTGSQPVVLQNLNASDPYGTANPMFRRATVNFSNGGATVSFNSFTAVTAMY